MFNFWQTKLGKSLDQTTDSVKKWMYAMLILTGVIAIAVVVKLFKK